LNIAAACVPPVCENIRCPERIRFMAALIAAAEVRSELPTLGTAESISSAVPDRPHNPQALTMVGFLPELPE